MKKIINQTNSLSRVICLLLGMLISWAAISQKTYYVKTSGSDANSGTSWAAAFKTLQKALATAGVSGDQIWVAVGTYYPDDRSGPLPG